MKKFAVLFLLLTPLINFAGITGKISGTIKDASSGEILIGANIFLENNALGAATDIDGNYVILNIPPGVYRMRISSLGYKTTIVEDVRVVADRTTNISVELSPTSLELEEIIVEAVTPLIQKDLTSSAAVITREEIEMLPVQNFTDLLSLQAGVVGSGSNLHVRGGRSNEVAYMVDGMYVTDPLLGGLATEISNDAIQEMTLLSGTFNAEYGNALSGVVNIVTRDGSDKLSGKLEYRTSSFGVERYSDLGEMKAVANISGPLFTNNLKFFLSAEKNGRDSYLPFGYDNVLAVFSKFTFTGLYGIKVGLSVRGSERNRRPYSHSWKYIPDQYLQVDTDSWQSMLTFTHTTSANLFYDVRVSYFDQGYYSGIYKDTSEYLSTAERQYFSEIGNGFEFYSLADPVEFKDGRTSTLDAKADLVWQLGTINEIKAGIHFKQHWLKYYNIYDPKRTFPYINNYETQPFEISGYIQDKIELPYLIINLGLRYDYINANVEFREDPLDPNSVITVKSREQFSPRIGIAHPISDRTKLHFSYGHFFQFPDYQYFFENNQYDLNVREPLFGQPGLDAERTISYEVGIAHQFTDRIALNLTAYYKDVTGKIGTRYYFPFTDGRYTGYTEYVNEDYSNIKGFELNLDIRSNRYFAGGLSYTYSVAKGSASSETEQYPGTQESTKLYFLDFDMTHMLNASATFLIPDDEGPSVLESKIFDNMDFSFIFRGATGYPYTPSGRDIGFVDKNSLRMPSVYIIDMIIGKEFRVLGGAWLRIFAEVLNLTDQRNVLYVYSDTGDPEITFEGLQSEEYMKDPSNYGPPRSIRIGAGIKF